MDIIGGFGAGTRQLGENDVLWNSIRGTCSLFKIQSCFPIFCILSIYQSCLMFTFSCICKNQLDLRTGEGLDLLELAPSSSLVVCLEKMINRLQWVRLIPASDVRVWLCWTDALKAAPLSPFTDRHQVIRGAPRMPVVQARRALRWESE